MMNAKQFIRRALVVVALAAWIVLVIFCLKNRDQITVDGIVRLSPANSFLAAMMMLCLFALKSITVVVWGALLYAASALLFPLPWALIVNFAGTLIMAGLPYYIGTRIDAKKLRARIDSHPHAALLSSLRNQNGLSFSFLSRMIALVPGDLLGMYCGAVRVRFSEYMLGSFLGMLPSMLTFTWMGGYIADPTSPQFLFSAALQVALSVASVVLYFAFRRIHSKSKA